MDIKFWTHNLIYFHTCLFWCPILDWHPTIHNSNVGVHLRWKTKVGKSTLYQHPPISIRYNEICSNSTWASALHDLMLFNLQAIFLQHTCLIITSWWGKTIDLELWRELWRVHLKITWTRLIGSLSLNMICELLKNNWNMDRLLFQCFLCWMNERLTCMW